MQSWEEYIKANVFGFRKDYGELPDEAKKMVNENSGIFKQSLNKPCQVVFFDFVKPYPKCFVILHEAKSPDMSIMVFEKTTPKNLSSKVAQDPKLVELIGKKRTETIVERMLDNIRPMSAKDSSWIAFSNFLLSTDAYLLWIREIPPLPTSSYELADMAMKHMMFDINNIIKDKQKEKIEKTVDDLKRDAELIPQNVELRDKIIESTRRLDSQFKQLDEQYKKLSTELVGVRKLVGTETFGEWKVLLSEIDRMKTRIDALSDIRCAYDKVLAQQNTFMEQQAEVMKQQSSFVNWIKYATILVPIAVISVPIIETILRHFLGIP